MCCKSFFERDSLAFSRYQNFGNPFSRKFFISMSKKTWIFSGSEKFPNFFQLKSNFSRFFGKIEKSKKVGFQLKKKVEIFRSEKIFSKNFQNVLTFFPLNRFSKFWYLEKANESLSNKHLQLI